MSAPQATTELKKLQAHIQVLFPSDEKLITLVAFRLPEFIKTHKVLEELWNGRMHSYRYLAEKDEYKALISELHVTMHELHRDIDLSQTPKSFRDPEAPDAYREKGRVLKQSIGKLIQDEEWVPLDEDNWRSVLLQYTEGINKLLTSLYAYKAISEGIYEKYSARFRELGNRLRLLIETPWHRDNLKAFHELQEFIDDPEHESVLKFEPSYKKIREAAGIVCSELLQALDRTAPSLGDVFPFAGTLTDFTTNLIYNEADRSSKQTLKHAKKRYVWEFYVSTYEKQKATQAQLNEFVNSRLKKFDHHNKLIVQRVTEKDIESLVATIAKRGNCSVKELSPCFVFEEDVFLRKIG